MRFVARSGETQVDICPADAGLVLSVGPVSISLDRASAEEIVVLLMLALASIRVGGVGPHMSN